MDALRGGRYVNSFKIFDFQQFPVIRNRAGGFRFRRNFLQIADEGSIPRAAGKLGVAQPALTRRIKQLEDELGAQLLTRLPRGVRLTPAGSDFLEHARKVMVEVSRARDQVRGGARAVRG